MYSTNLNFWGGGCLFCLVFCYCLFSLSIYRNGEKEGRLAQLLKIDESADTLLSQCG